MDTFLTPKNAKKFNCENCVFKCSKQSDWNRHILTRKHQNTYKGVTNDTFFTPKPANQFECECGNTYKFRQGLYKHRNKCLIHQGVEDSNTNTIIPTVTGFDMEQMAKMFTQLITQNQDFMKDLITVMPITNQCTNNNSHNTTNNQFNIQMFLNEHCKDAMNLTDFIESLPITAETYDDTIENGLTKSITKMMVNGLSELDILKRPIHCTDASRKTLYVKDNDIWEKDNELLHMLKGISELSFKQRVNIHKWQDENEGWDVNDDLQTKITMLVFHTMADLDNDEKETRKIISTISKNTYLTNEIKSQYV